MNLYKMHNASGVVVYVGITSDVPKRVRQHAEKAWFAEVAWIETTAYEDRAAAAAAETEAIRDLSPRFNRSQNANYVGDPVVVPIKSVAPPFTGGHARTGKQLRNRRYVTMKEAADYLGVTDRTIRQMIADGRLTGYRSGPRLVRLDVNEIDAAMKPFGGGTVSA